MIEVVLEDEPEAGCMERCCMCRARTHYWYAPKDVACCTACAEISEPEDLPTKDQWFATEAAASQRLRPSTLPPVELLNRALNAGWRFAGSGDLFNLVPPDPDSRRQGATWKTVSFHLPHFTQSWLEQRGLTQGLPPTKESPP